MTLPVEDPAWYDDRRRFAKANDDFNYDDRLLRGWAMRASHGLAEYGPNAGRHYAARARAHPAAAPRAAQVVPLIYVNLCFTARGVGPMPVPLVVVNLTIVAQAGAGGVRAVASGSRGAGYRPGSGSTTVAV